jgi:hypothetical protein
MKIKRVSGRVAFVAVAAAVTALGASGAAAAKDEIRERTARTGEEA